MIKKNNLRSLRLTNRCQFILCVTALLSASPALAAYTNLNWKANLTLKETYDDNVYLEDKAPGPGVPGAVPARKDSWVTTITPYIAVDDKVCSGFNAGVSYTPDIAIYHNAHSEDYTAHHIGATFGGKADQLTWEQANAFTDIDGNHLGPIFANPQDCPAIGGIPLRNRRDAAIYLGSFKLTYTLDRFFIRPAANAYVHDFKTVQMPSPAGGIYENYIDRQDVNGGVDIGCDLGKKTYLVLGYRYGRQDQYKLLGAYSPYDRAYHRILIGVEGSPAPWIKLAVLGGPDFSDWAPGTPAGFDRNKIVYWINAKVTLLPTKNDTIVLFHRSYEQPAFASVSVYQDITTTLTWTHRLNDHFSANAGMELYIGDWQAPALRDDWIYTPSAGLTYTYNQHLNAELTYSYDWAENMQSGVATGEGREFTRNLVSLAVQCTF